MTPQEKAKELFDNFFTEVDENNYTSFEWGKATAKNCALIAVGEMATDSKDDGRLESLEYWNQVKEEIEKL